MTSGSTKRLPSQLLTLSGIILDRQFLKTSPERHAARSRDKVILLLHSTYCNLISFSFVPYLLALVSPEIESSWLHSLANLKHTTESFWVTSSLSLPISESGPSPLLRPPSSFWLVLALRALWAFGSRLRDPVGTLDGVPSLCWWEEETELPEWFPQRQKVLLALPMRYSS